VAVGALGRGAPVDVAGAEGARSADCTLQPARHLGRSRTSRKRRREHADVQDIEVCRAETKDIERELGREEHQSGSIRAAASERQHEKKREEGKRE
jgi:hypothetical protein